MKTKLVKINKTNLHVPEMVEAANIIRQGGLVAFPTETVYGLGANALKEEAAERIYAAKGRPSDNPLIAHIANVSDLKILVSEIPEAAEGLIEKYWPGPLTIIFPKSTLVPYQTTGGLDTVAVRMPSDPVANYLIELSGVPIAAPSANVSGRPSPTTAEHVFEDMNGRIEMILDSGPVGIGLESTIVDATGKVPVLLRPGAITIEMLWETVGEVQIDPAILEPMKEGAKPKAPGMKYRHYAPKAELILVENETQQIKETARNDDNSKVVETINRLAYEEIARGHKVGIICTNETRNLYPLDVEIRSLGKREQEEMIAHNLFGVLRDFDELDVDIIYSESFAQKHLGQAIMNRLTKAAGYHILKV